MINPLCTLLNSLLMKCTILFKLIQGLKLRVRFFWTTICNNRANVRFFPLFLMVCLPVTSCNPLTLLLIKYSIWQFPEKASRRPVNESTGSRSHPTRVFTSRTHFSHWNTLLFKQYRGGFHWTIQIQKALISQGFLYLSGLCRIYIWWWNGLELIG